MKKVLIIAYYWPPGGGGGVQRWLKFVKYLRTYGWEPIVYAPENADYPLMDESLANEIPEGVEVLKQPIWEVRKVYQQWMGGKSSPKQNKKVDEIFYMDPQDRSWKQNLSLWIRGNMFIPDARVSWVSPSVKFLSQYLRKHPVDVVVSTGPPHSMHLIGMRLKRKLGITWVADFRDPWTDIEFFDKMMLTKGSDGKHRRLEREVHQEADAVIKVAPYWIKRDAKHQPKKTVVITNGYDEDDFLHDPPPLSDKFLISHAGTLANDRNPHSLWQALEELCEELPGFKTDLQIQVLGKTDSSVLAAAKARNLDRFIENTGYVSHAEAIRIMQSSQVLLLLINEVAFNAPGRMTGKIFEYLAARRPILLIGPVDGDPAQVLRETQSGVAVGFGEKEELKRTLSKYYQAYQTNSLVLNSEGYQQYSRKNTTKQLAELLVEVVG